MPWAHARFVRRTPALDCTLCAPTVFAVGAAAEDPSRTPRRAASLTCNIMLHGGGQADRHDPCMYAVLGIGVVIGVIWAVRHTLDRLRMYG
jgi:hypothetical protein